MLVTLKELQDYSYQYNGKITGVTEKKTSESAFDTATVCVNLFYQMGVNIKVWSPDTAHRVPTRNKKKPFPIICKFLQRLDIKKMLWGTGKKANDIDPVALGFATVSPEFTMSTLVYSKTSPRQKNPYLPKPKSSKPRTTLPFAGLKADA